MMKAPYDHRLKSIDEQLVKLIAERLQISRGTNGYPTKEQIDRWCQEYPVDGHVIASVLPAMNNPWRAPRLAVSPQNLLHIIPIMHKIRREDITYQITRIEQYIDCSLVYVNIYTGEEAKTGTVELNVHLMLDIEPNDGWQVEFHGSSGRANDVRWFTW